MSTVLKKAAQPSFLATKAEYLKKCGESIYGPIEQTCGKYLPKSNWMRTDGMDSRLGHKGNAPLCKKCAEY
jgi:hypothetical protein